MSATPTTYQVTNPPPRAPYSPPATPPTNQGTNPPPPSPQLSSPPFTPTPYQANIQPPPPPMSPLVTPPSSHGNSPSLPPQKSYKPPPPPIYQAPPQPIPPNGPEGWQHVDNPHDTLYWQIGRFIVLMHRLVYNKEFTLVDVISVSMQPAGNGNNYFVVFKAADENKKVRRYQSLVWGITKSTAQPWKVLSFQDIGE